MRETSAKWGKIDVIILPRQEWEDGYSPAVNEIFYKPTYKVHYEIATNQILTLIRTIPTTQIITIQLYSAAQPGI